MNRSQQAYIPRIYGFRIHKDSSYFSRRESSPFSRRRGSPGTASPAVLEANASGASSEPIQLDDVVSNR